MKILFLLISLSILVGCKNLSSETIGQLTTDRVCLIHENAKVYKMFNYTGAYYFYVCQECFKEKYK